MNVTESPEITTAVTRKELKEMKRQLLSGAIYRKIWFDNHEEFEKYLNGGCKERWTVRYKKDEFGYVVEVIGERYNGSAILRMNEFDDEFIEMGVDE